MAWRMFGGRLSIFNGIRIFPGLLGRLSIRAGARGSVCGRAFG